MSVSHLEHDHHRTSWYEDDGEFRLLGGSSLTSQCEPHFHETYSVAFVTRGEAHVTASGVDLRIGPGTAFFLNPYQIVSCTGSAEFAYDICYPSAELMMEVGRRIGWPSSAPPLFGQLHISGMVAESLKPILEPFNGHEPRPFSMQADAALVEFFAAHPSLFGAAPQGKRRGGCALRAKDLIEELIDQPLTVNDISRRLRTSRSYFVRSFSSDVGISPSWYIRQKRLSRGLEYIRRGHQLAEAAVESGFCDQAHFTREFKRFYGTTPGKLIRDVAHRRAENSQSAEAKGSAVL